MKIKKDKNFYLIIELVLLFILGITQIFSISSICLIIVFIILYLMIISDFKCTSCMLFVALPFFNLFNYKIGSTSLYYLFIIAFICKYLVYKRYKISRNKIYFFLLLVLVRIPSGDFVELIKWILLLSVLFIVFNESFFTDQLDEIIFYLTISAILSSAFGYYMLEKQLSIYTQSYVYSENGITTRFAGLIGDSVFYAQFVALIVSANLIIAYYSSKKRIKHIIVSTILAGFDILTYSKTGIILIVIMYFLYIISFIIKSAKNKKTFIKSIITFLILIVGITYFKNYFILHTDNSYVINYIARFTSEDLSTGRNVVTDHYLNLLNNSWRTPFFAMSQDVYSTKFYTNGLNAINRAHNIYIESVCAFGLSITLIIFIWVFYQIYKTIRNGYYFSTISMFVLLASGFVLHGHYEFQYYFLVAIALSMLRYPNLMKISNKL
ncbi:TPA: hypothetical protein ACOTHS_000598 [Clostridium perfringens]|nr:O-antigen ligase [Clostridium perfringens]